MSTYRLAGALAVVLACAAAGPETDSASPKGALKNFYEAMESGDVAAVRASLHASSDGERALADAYAAQLTAARALGEAAKTKFAASGDALTKGLPTRDEVARLEGAEVKVDGDSATVKLLGQTRTLRLVKSEGRWRLAVADYAGARGPEALAAQTAVLKDMATALNGVATDILADKFPSAVEAQRALQQKLQSVMYNTLQKHPPTTGKADVKSQKPDVKSGEGN